MVQEQPWEVKGLERLSTLTNPTVDTNDRHLNQQATNINNTC